MRRTIAPIIAVLTLALSAGSAIANVDAGGVPRLSTSDSFTAPVGFQIFCMQNSRFCRGGGRAEIALTPAVLETLNAVNRRLNNSISPAIEPQDIWAVGVSHGDCEDYVLAKRAELISAGLPASALRIAAVKTAQGMGHAVLVVRTTTGDLVLDNLTSQIKMANQTSHFWVAMTDANGRTWRRIS